MPAKQRNPLDWLGEWAADAVQRLGVDPANAEAQTRVVQRFLSEAGIDCMGDLRAPVLMRWLAGESRRKRPRTVRNELCAIRQFGRFLAAVEAVPSSPFESVRVARCVSDDGCAAISVDQATALVELARSEAFDGSRRWQTRWNAGNRLIAYMLMLELGLRVGEVRAQRWEDVDLDKRILRVSRDKSRRRDAVELPSKMVAALRWHRRCQIRAGSGCERVVSVGPNAKKMRSDLDAVGCNGETGRFHRLRKHAITQRALSGWDVWLLARFARHRDPKTTMRYVKPADDIRRTVIPN